MRGFFDGEQVFSFKDTKAARGAVGLRAWAPFHFRNLSVKTPEGKVLWEGLPKLPAPGDTPKTVYPVAGPKAPGIERMDAVMLTAMEHPDSGAIGVAIANQGQLLYSRGYGWLDREKKTPAPADVRIGSTFFFENFVISAAIRNLARRGKFKLDDKLLTVYPIKPAGKIADERVNDITIGQVLDNRTGWGTDPTIKARELAKKQKLPEPLTAKTLLEFILTEPLANKPGEKNEGCSFNHVLLKDLVVHVSGKNFADYVNNELFKPLVVPEFAEFRQGLTRDPKAVWNADETGVPFCGSAPGFCQLIFHYAPGGEFQNGWWWKGGYNWTGGSMLSFGYRDDGLDIVFMTNGHLKANYDWGHELNLVLERMKRQWLASQPAAKIVEKNPAKIVAD